MVKVGSGTQVLSGANVYGGGTLVTEGTLAVANASGSGTGSGYVLVVSNATFSIGNGGAGGAIAAATITNHGTVVLDRSDNFTLPQLITGEGGLWKTTINTATIATANTYTNETVIDAGALRVSHANALGTTDGQTFIDNTASSRLELAGGITVMEQLEVSQKLGAAGNVPCVVNVSGNNTLACPILAGEGGSYWRFRVDADKLTVSGSFTNITDSSPAAGRRLVLQGVGEGDWQSSIGNRSTPVSVTALIKEGAGSWTLSGTNTYTGATKHAARLSTVVVNMRFTLHQEPRLRRPPTPSTQPDFLSSPSCREAGEGVGGAGKVSLSLGELTNPFKLAGTLAHPSLAIDKTQALITVGKTAGALALHGPAGILTALTSTAPGDANACRTAIEGAKTKGKPGAS